MAVRMGEQTPPGPERLAGLTENETWRQALRDVPREWFVPERAWATPMGAAPSYWIDRATDPQPWYEAVYSDSTIVTQIEDGGTDLTEESARSANRFTSSNSAPSNVTSFLELLDTYDKDRVLEIGTGTGWTTGLLSARLGAENITSVEVDEQVAKQARVNLERVGYMPNLITGDGEKGHPGGAPFDRIHVTCGVRKVPYTWVEQTRPGGIIVLPWMPGLGGYQVKLTATNDGAVGRFTGNCGYMMMRSQRPTNTPIADDDRESHPGLIHAASITRVRDVR
ncbi:methyltransferase domain-containing protein [Haloactinospora alba]|uniref:methyltransferase domain-containing protein n=1 Tax=Haloactinospora alba TaxID=405555 RepID=UPI00114EB77D|nr:methyltransferase domain-containing protein [Haloactinospora alba]